MPGTLLTAVARGCRRTQTRFGLGTIGYGGAHSSVAPTICLLAPQCAASRSARAGGGCYARNVRVSGSPLGSKRTTNNLSARRPPPLSASLRSPAFLPGGGAVAGRWAGLSLVPLPPWALAAVRHSLPPTLCPSCWKCLNQLVLRSHHHPVLTRHSYRHRGTTSKDKPRTPLRWLQEGSVAFWRWREDCKAVHIRPALTVLPANRCFGPQ